MTLDTLPASVTTALAQVATAERRVLWVSAEYAPDIGGSQLSFRVAIRALARRGWGAVVISDEFHGHRVVDCVPVIAASRAGSAFDDTFDAVCHTLRPALIATQLSFAERALRLAHERKIPSVYFLRDPHDNVAPSAAVAPTLIIGNSARTVEQGRQVWSRNVALLRPMIDPTMVVVERTAPRCITVVNTFPIKGADRLFDVAAIEPSRQFIAVRCWTLASRAKFAEHEVDFSSLPNVEVIGPVAEMGPIYQRTAVLLVPSRWQEPFGRVVAEAHLNGIPVIGSPSLREVWGDTVAYVDEPDDPAAWQAALRALDDDDRRHALVACGQRWAKAYRPDDETVVLESFLSAAISGDPSTLFAD